MSELVYLYGFVPAAAPEPPPPPRLDGIAGRPVTLVGRGGIRAAVSRVPADTYHAGAIEARIDDLDWVAEQGLAHERVVSWFVDHGDIVPVALFTLYSGDAALAADMRARSADVERTFERLAGQREWDLKVAYEPAVLEAAIAAASEAVSALDAEIAAAAPGRRFLLQRKRSDLVRDEVRRVAAERADAMFEELGAYARDSVRLSIPATSERLPVLLHAALLVERTAETALARAVDARSAELAPLGISAALSGPWAPYRFLRPAGDAGELAP